MPAERRVAVVTVAPRNRLPHVLRVAGGDRARAGKPELRGTAHPCAPARWLASLANAN